ncbi:hypothetical protein [Streptomyces sp. NPDC001292]
MRPAIWIGVAVVFVGALCALAIPRKAPDAQQPAVVDAQESELSPSSVGP